MILRKNKERHKMFITPQLCNGVAGNNIDMRENVLFVGPQQKDAGNFTRHHDGKTKIALLSDKINQIANHPTQGVVINFHVE
jgi:hypothetical protein